MASVFDGGVVRSGCPGVIGALVAGVLVVGGFVFAWWWTGHEARRSAQRRSAEMDRVARTLLYWPETPEGREMLGRFGLPTDTATLVDAYYKRFPSRW